MRKKIRQWIKLGLLGFVLVVLPAMNGCAKRPSAEEMKQLQEAKKAAEAAEAKLAGLKSEKLRLENEIKTTEEAIKNCEQQKVTLQDQIDALEKGKK